MFLLFLNRKVKSECKLQMDFTKLLDIFWVMTFSQRSHAGGPIHLNINLVYCVILFLSSNSFLAKKVSNMDLSWEFVLILRTATLHNASGQQLLLHITICNIHIGIPVATSIPISIPVCNYLFQKQEWEHWLRGVLRKKCSQKFRKSRRKTPAWESLFFKVARWKCFPVKFSKFKGTTFI